MVRSPFPGMDPYLEPHWLDVHTKLVAYAADELNRVLPETLVARTEERVAVESDWEGGRELDPVIERFIRILDQSGRLITVIEFVSPTNKFGEGLKVYRQKRGELLEAGVNLVEVDLVRQGDWRALMWPHLCPRDALAAYRVTVRTPPGAAAFLFPAPLRDPLPDVPVPLRPEDPRVLLPLQRLVDQLYANGRYGMTIDYRQPCEPALETEDAAWAADLLRLAGKRA